MKKAIVIPFNPHRGFWGGTAIGSIIAHKFFADKNGAVFWDLDRARPHDDVETAYFYDTDLSAVTYKASVDFVAKKAEIDHKQLRFIPNWRRVNWDTSQNPGQVWLKLKDIFPLKRKKELHQFRKVEGGNLERVMNFAIVEDPCFSEERKSISLDQLIDDHIYRLVSQREEKLTETDIEELLWYIMLENNLAFVERQRGKDDRIDVAFKGPASDFVIIEIKKGTAGLETLQQIKRYIEKIRIEQKTNKVSGIILCKRADIELQHAVEQEENILVDEYVFSLDFPTIRKRLANALV